jgi:hypothetical protein
MDQREAANRAAAEHVARLRARLRDGKDEIERQRASVSETQHHLTGMRRWIENTAQQLGDERSRRAANS